MGAGSRSSYILPDWSNDFLPQSKSRSMDGFPKGEIVDNGRGFDPENVARGVNSPHGLGLLDMQERITQCGGNMDVFSQTGKGTRIQIRIPLVEINDE